MGVSSTRVGDHRGSARTVQFSQLFSSSESSEVRTTHPSTHTWAQKNTWAKSRHSPSTGLGRILFSRPSSPRCLTHIHVGVGFDRVGLRNRCSLNWAGSGLPRVCGFNSHSASSNCVYFTNFIHPPTSPPLFHPLSSMIPFLKSASSKPGRWSNPRNLFLV